MDVKPAEVVNRFDVINAIKETYCVGCDSYHGIRCRACNFDDAMSAIDSVPAFDLKTIRELVPKWISVKDRLPEIGDSYLVTVKEKYDYEAEWRYHVDVAGSHGEYIDGFWDTFNDWNEGQEVHVTHWMPLPEPPKEE